MDFDIEKIIDTARDVLRQEADALQLLAEKQDDSFARAVKLIFETKGRVIVTGMGKSGHVGHKIAASMSSLGTTAYFVHPGEASHGDLGMIEPVDIIIALSNSGEAPELGDIIAFCRRFDVKLIAMTGNRNSTLAKNANVVLCIPEIEEACPFGMAPTTSTTLMMAWGDALAVALLKLHNFSKEQYKMRHPGGKLGKMMLNVSDLFHTDMPLIDEDTLMPQALEVMTVKGFGCVGIVNGEGELVGMFTDGDLRRSICPGFISKKIKDVMVLNPKTTTKDTPALEALRIMNTTGKGITALFAVDENKKPVGLLHMHDCLRAGMA
ncbi:MAG: KpsF/GutQ family sugar-phosphate isomerase [Alphaproteobacteria bacterium]|nr:KpsF/GutQ family sugar-phosphate isomerase [Alphaproteobacteria bacterium]